MISQHFGHKEANGTKTISQIIHIFGNAPMLVMEGHGNVL